MSFGRSFANMHIILKLIKNTRRANETQGWKGETSAQTHAFLTAM